MSSTRAGPAEQGTVKTINARQAMIETTKQFWDGHFDQQERVFNDDWIMTPETSCEACRRVIRPGGSVLVVGCGMSHLPFLLHQEGFLVTAIDISDVAVMKMQSQTPPGGPTFLVGDVTRLPLVGGRFDAVLDKGTSDTLFFRNANAYRCALVTAMWSEVGRVLRADGVYVNITPRMRVPWLKELFPSDQGWTGVREAFTFDPEQLESCLQLKLEDPRRGQERKETVFVHTYRRGPQYHSTAPPCPAKTKAERRAERAAAKQPQGCDPLLG